MINAVADHFDLIARDYDNYKKNSWYYYNSLKKLLQDNIGINKKILEIGCGTGDLLVSLKPSSGVGIDISKEMIKVAKRKNKKNKDVWFTTKPIPKVKGIYDYIIMCDVVEHVPDLKSLFEDICSLMGLKTIFIITMANPLWEPLLIVAEKLKLKMPEGKHYRASAQEIVCLLESSGMKVIRHNKSLLLPVYIPVISTIVNRLFSGTLQNFCFIEYLIIKKDESI